MAVVKAGKFMMSLVSFAIVANESNGNLGKGLDWEEARKRVFKGMTQVEGTTRDFRQINEMLSRIPVFKPFEIEEGDW